MARYGPLYAEIFKNFYYTHSHSLFLSRFRLLLCSLARPQCMHIFSFSVLIFHLHCYSFRMNRSIYGALSDLRLFSYVCIKPLRYHRYHNMVQFISYIITYITVQCGFFYFIFHFCTVDLNFPLKIKPSVFNSNCSTKLFCTKYNNEMNEWMKVWRRERGGGYIRCASQSLSIVNVCMYRSAIFFSRLVFLCPIAFVFPSAIFLPHNTICQIERLLVSNKTLKLIIPTCYSCEWSTWNWCVKITVWKLKEVWVRVE